MPNTSYPAVLQALEHHSCTGLPQLAAHAQHLFLSCATGAGAPLPLRPPPAAHAARVPGHFWRRDQRGGGARCTRLDLPEHSTPTNYGMHRLIPSTSHSLGAQSYARGGPGCSPCRLPLFALRLEGM